MGRARGRGSPKPSRLGCEPPRPQRAEPAGARRPPRRSQPPRGGLTLSHPWGREREPPPPSRAGGRCSAPELDFTAHPRSASPRRRSATRVAAHPSGAFPQLLAPRPLRLARAAAGARSRARASQGPAPAPTPIPLRAELPAEAMPRAGSPLAELGARPRGPAHRPQAAFGGKAPLRRPPRRSGGKAPRPASSAPPLGGSRLLQRGGGRGGAREKREVGFLGPALGSPPSGAPSLEGAALARCSALPGVCFPPHPPSSVLAPSRAEPLAGAHRSSPLGAFTGETSEGCHKSVTRAQFPQTKSPLCSINRPPHSGQTPSSKTRLEDRPGNGAPTPAPAGGRGISSSGARGSGPFIAFPLTAFSARCTLLRRTGAL